MLNHKTRLNKFKIEIISNIFSNHNGIKLEIITGEKTEKTTNVETKQLATKTPIGQQRNQRKTQKML